MRDFGHDPARYIRVIHDTDDLVVGSGPGGIDREFKGRAKAMGAAPPASQSLSYLSDSEGCKLLAHRLGAPPHRTPIEQMQAGGDRMAHAATRDMACCAVSGQGSAW